MFDGIDFHINKWDKIALVAKNGAGKSTLLKVLYGEIDRGDGDIVWAKGIKVWFLSQKNKLETNKTVLEILFDTKNTQIQDERTHEIKVKTIISKLQINPFLHQNIDSLSGGEAKRIALAKVLVDEPDFLILDEPTNHLDLESIEWLENYLHSQNITLLMVTHDRYFLERVCSVIFELDRGQLYKYPGNYSYFLEKKMQRQEHEDIYMKKLRKQLKQELAWIRKAPRARASKSIDREKYFYKIEDKYDTQKAIVKTEKIKFDIAMEERKLWNKICKIYNLSKNFDEKKIIENFSYDFKNKERIGIVGKNGVGKSTFVRMLLNEESINSGKIIIEDNIVFGHYQQDDIQFKPNQRVIDVITDISEYMHIGKNQKISASKALQNFLFPASQQYAPANNLSGGEKRRLYLLSVLIKNPNFLILDEPTNDLDLLTIGILEEFLLQYQGCLIIISHDRFFMDKITDRLFVFQGGGVIENFWWSYSDYKQASKRKKQEEKKNKHNQKNPKTPLATSKEEVKKRLSYNEKRELEQIEKNLELLEKRKNQINKLFDNKDLPYDEIRKLSEEIAEIIGKIEKHEERWMTLSQWV